MGAALSPDPVSVSYLPPAPVDVTGGCGVAVASRDYILARWQVSQRWEFRAQLSWQRFVDKGFVIKGFSRIALVHILRQEQAALLHRLWNHSRHKFLGQLRAGVGQTVWLSTALHSSPHACLHLCACSCRVAAHAKLGEGSSRRLLLSEGQSPPGFAHTGRAAEGQGRNGYPQVVRPWQSVTGSQSSALDDHVQVSWHAFIALTCLCAAAFVAATDIGRCLSCKEREGSC